MIDGGAAIFANLQAIVLMVRHRTGDIGSEFQREVAGVGAFRALHEHDRRLALALQYDRFRDVTGRGAYQRHVIVYNEEFASVCAGVQKHQMLRTLLDRLRIVVAAAAAVAAAATLSAGGRAGATCRRAVVVSVLVDVVQRALNRVEVREIASLELQILEAGPDVNAPVQLPEALLPRVRVVGLVRRHKLKFTRRGIKQRQVVLVDLLVKRLPELRVVRDRLETLADLRHSAQVLLHEIIEYCEQHLVRQLVLKIMRRCVCVYTCPDKRIDIRINVTAKSNVHHSRRERLATLDSII